MTKLLEEAFAAVFKLSEERQNAIAAMILQEIASGQFSTELADSQMSTEREYPDPEPEISAYMERQAEIFAQMKDELLKQYRGMYVLFEDGKTTIMM